MERRKGRLAVALLAPQAIDDRVRGDAAAVEVRRRVRLPLRFDVQRDAGAERAGRQQPGQQDQRPAPSGQADFTRSRPFQFRWQ